MVAESKSFDEVKSAELAVIGKERARLSLKDKAMSEDLFGVAFSGGGIRSATFNLGVLQGLTNAKLLKHADYLSTVSGGGYIGSWLSAWIWRSDRKVENVEEALSSPASVDAPEAKPIAWLRRYSNYLTVRVGFLSTDTLAGVATFARNLLLNFIELVSLLGAVLILPLLLGWVLRHADLPWLYVGAIAFALSLFFMNLNFYDQGSRDKKSPWYQSRRGVLWLVVVPLLVAGSALGFAVAAAEPRGAFDFLADHWWKAFVLALGLQVLAWLYHAIRGGESLGAAPAEVRKAIVSLAKAAEPERPTEYRYRFPDWFRIVVGVAVAVSIGLLALWLFQSLLPSTAKQPAGLWHTVVWALPVAIVAFGLASVLFVGLVGRTFSEEMREWWSRLGGWLIGILIAWIVVVGSAIYGPDLLGRIRNWTTGLGAAWILSTLAGVLAGRSRLSAGTDAKRWVEWIAKVAPYVFIVGLLLAVSFLVNAGLSTIVAQTQPVSTSYDFAELRVYPSFENYAQQLYSLVEFGNGIWLVAALGVLAIIVIGLARTVDVNVFSFHMFYRNRLVRCYLGASNDAKETRREHPFTGFDPADSPTMSDLADQRPFHIINTAINLTRTKNLAWQERKAASFTISPLFCGYSLNPFSTSEGGRYQVTADYLDESRLRSGSKKGGWLGLGTALTISGAAASPNMGYHTSPATAFLMTVFNMRLGWWMQNTQSLKNWSRKGPRFGILWLVRELFAMADETRPFVYLSDGGHFENLGIYELVRRRCRFILAVDAGHDSDFRFEDLGNAVRKCQVDLNTRIEIDTRAIVPDAKTGRSLVHCAVGEIHYPSALGEKDVGLLLYIKPSFTGNEPADVRQYAAAHPDFPHESTADQWFNESQFESYRKLGQHVMETVFESVSRQEEQRARKLDQADSSRSGERDLEWIFVNLKERWYPPGAATAGAFTRHGDQFKAIEEAIRNDENLRFMDAQLLPEWPKLIAGRSDAQEVWLGLPRKFEELRAGFYVCANMLQLMENVYRDLHLEEEWEHPDNRGWVNLFKHWSWSAIFMVTYSICCGMYGARFQRWCERRLDLRAGKIEPRELDVPGGAEGIKQWLGDLEKQGEINFVEAAKVEPYLKPKDKLVLLQLKQESSPEFPAHRGGRSPLLVYTFGIAAVRPFAADGETRYRLSFFRIQDHLRRMGLARRAMRSLAYRSTVKVEESALDKDFPQKEEIERILHSVVGGTPTAQ